MARYCSECAYLDVNSSDLYGKFWCEAKLERHSANELECSRFCYAYNRDSGVSKSAYDYSNNNSGGGCYLTTMLCNILGFDDNNMFLKTLRDFRQNVLQKDEIYKSLLVEYDIIGPEIAKALNNDPLKVKIAVNNVNNYLIPITTHIKKKEYNKAIYMYIEMTNNLKKLYQIDNKVTKKEINDADISKSGHGVYQKKITNK